MTILVAGHYCHDTLLQESGRTRTLGGSASYISAIFDAFQIDYDVAAKAGPDFAFSVSRKPIPAAAPTVHFIDDYRSGERSETCTSVCEPLTPEDLPARNYEVGIACGIAGEVTLPVLRKMRSQCRLVLADAQSLLREIAGTEVRLVNPPPEAIDLVDVVKASVKEAAWFDREKIGTLLITDGPRGCRVLGNQQEEFFVPAFPATERDPTGAGDCFLAGVAIGLARGWTLQRAARLGSWCGARAVESVGVPKLEPRDVHGWGET